MRKFVSWRQAPAFGTSFPNSHLVWSLFLLNAVRESTTLMELSQAAWLGNSSSVQVRASHQTKLRVGHGASDPFKLGDPWHRVAASSVALPNSHIGSSYRLLSSPLSLWCGFSFSLMHAHSCYCSRSACCLSFSLMAIWGKQYIGRKWSQFALP